MGAELRLVGRHVDVDRAVALAALAGEAQRSSASSTASLRQPSSIGPPCSISNSSRARPRVEYFSSWVTCSSGTSPRRRLSWRRHLPTPTQRCAARAKLPSFGIVEVGLELRRLVARAEPQVGGDRVGIDHLAGVHRPLRVPDRLELAERLRSAPGRTSSAAARRAPGRRRARRRASRRSAPPDRPPRRGMAPVLRCPARRRGRKRCGNARSRRRNGRRRRTRSRTCRTAPSARADRRPRFSRRHGAVLPALPGVGLVRHVGRGAERSLAHLPDPLLLVLVTYELRRRRRPAPLKASTSPAPCARLPPRCRPPNSTISQPCPSGSTLRSSACRCLILYAVDQRVVDAFEADRLVLQDARHGVGGRKMSGKPMMASTRSGGLGIRSSVASSTVTQVPSVPTSARATLKPFSGSSWSRFVAGDAARDLGEARADQVGS